VAPYRFDGDESSPSSDDALPHSIPVSALSVECGEFSPLL
jgi:hypothetical protein